MSTGRDDDDPTWSELVDAFHAEPEPGAARRWPAAEDVDPDERADIAESDPLPGASHTWEERAEDGSHAHHGLAARSPHAEAADTGVADQDHFVPPNPPPLPRGDRISRWAWTGLAAAPSVLLLSAVTGRRPPDTLMLLLVGGFIAGFVTLVARMRGRNPHDPDDGAVV